MKIKNQIEKEYEVIEWRYYIGVKDNDEKMQSFLRYLNVIGFLAVTKPVKKIMPIFDEHPSVAFKYDYIYKANFDVEMMADILLDKSGVKDVIIFSGDSDFAHLVKILRNMGKGVSIYSSKKTISWELKLAASKIIFLENIKNLIIRDDKKYK